MSTDAAARPPKKKRAYPHRKRGAKTSHSLYFARPETYDRLVALGLSLGQSASAVADAIFHAVLDEVEKKAPRLRVFQVQAIIKL